MNHIAINYYIFLTFSILLSFNCKAFLQVSNGYPVFFRNVNNWALLDDQFGWLMCTFLTNISDLNIVLRQKY